MKAKASTKMLCKNTRVIRQQYYTGKIMLLYARLGRYKYPYKKEVPGSVNAHPPELR